MFSRAASLIAAMMLLAAPSPARSAEKVALKPTGDRFLRVTGDGTLHAAAQVPGEAETFELFRRGEGQIALKALNGRFLIPDATNRKLRVGTNQGDPGDRETLALVLAGENRAGLRAPGRKEFIVFDGKPPRPIDQEQPDQPRSEETLEIWRITELTPELRATFSSGLRDLLTSELTGRQYDKTRTRQREKFLDLPAPTRRDLLHTKPQRVFSFTEEYQIHARLDGPLEIEILQLPFLRGYLERGEAALVFAVRSRIPIAGRVQYRIPDRLSASTGYKAVIGLDFAGQVRLKKSGDQLTLDSPRLHELRAEFRSLDLSNDILSALRNPIKDVINHELRQNHDHLRHKANQALAKAVEAREFQHPLLRYFGLP